MSSLAVCVSRLRCLAMSSGNCHIQKYICFFYPACVCLIECFLKIFSIPFQGQQGSAANFRQKKSIIVNLNLARPEKEGLCDSLGLLILQRTLENYVMYRIMLNKYIILGFSLFQKPMFTLCTSVFMCLARA